uniref:Uncharacterized protein n=1 Tax=Acrobeloides nanus TaxID=290746 RepID=A0A914E577_9BILA
MTKNGAIEEYEAAKNRFAKLKRLGMIEIHQRGSICKRNFKCPFTTSALQTVQTSNHEQCPGTSNSSNLQNFGPHQVFNPAPGNLAIHPRSEQAMEKHLHWCFSN